MAPFELAPQQTDDPKVLQVALAGELDLTNARELEERIAELATGDVATVVLDLNRVVFIDSAALHVLFRTARTGRVAIVISPGAPIARTVEIVGLSQAAVVGEALETVLARIESG